MPRQRRLASPGQLPLNAPPRVQLRRCRKKALCVCRCAQKVRGFFQRLVVFEREHHNRLLSVAGDNQRLVVVANAVHRTRQIRSNRRVGNRIHFGVPYMYGLLYMIANHLSNAEPLMRGTTWRSAGPSP